MFLITIPIIFYFITSYVLCLARIFQKVDNEYNLYVPEGTITVRDSDLYQYDPNMAAIMIKTGSMLLTQIGPRYISIVCCSNCILIGMFVYPSIPGDICRQSSLLHFHSCSSYAHLIYMDNVNHMYPHEILSNSIPLYIYYNCYFYHNQYDHVVSIALIYVHVIIFHIEIIFIILLQFHLFILISLYRNIFYKQSSL